MMPWSWSREELIVDGKYHISYSERVPARDQSCIMFGSELNFGTTHFLVLSFFLVLLPILENAPPAASIRQRRCRYVVVVKCYGNCTFTFILMLLALKSRVWSLQCVPSSASHLICIAISPSTSPSPSPHHHDHLFFSCLLLP